MSTLPTYQKEEFKKMSWDKYYKIVSILHTKISSYLSTSRKSIDTVVPILREGLFPAGILAYKLKQLSIVPVQYKYLFYEKKKAELKCLLPFNNKVVRKNNPTILLVENAHCFGLTAETAAKDIKEMFPNSFIIYATDTADVGYVKNRFADIMFYGELSNACKTISEEECKKRNISPDQDYYPWESIDEEWDTVNAKQYGFSDLSNVRKTGKVSKIINF